MPATPPPAAEPAVPSVPRVPDAGASVAVAVGPRVPDAGVAPARPVEPPLAPAGGGTDTDRLRAHYLGTHGLGVNRISDSRRLGEARITAGPNGGLVLEGSLQGRGRDAAYRIALSGKVTPRGERAFVLDGQIEGVPDMRWAGEKPRPRRTEGTFVFRAKGKRRYWRLYEVNGRNCVCNDRCGNDFCYIDIDF